MNKRILSLLGLLLVSSMAIADFGDVLGPTLTGAAIGGIAGGGRGAAIGAGVGFGVGAISSTEKDRQRGYYYDDEDYYDPYYSAYDYNDDGYGYYGPGYYGPRRYYGRRYNRPVYRQYRRSWRR